MNLIAGATSSLHAIVGIIIVIIIYRRVDHRRFVSPRVPHRGITRTPSSESHYIYSGITRQTPSAIGPQYYTINNNNRSRRGGITAWSCLNAGSRGRCVRDYCKQLSE